MGLWRLSTSRWSAWFLKLSLCKCHRPLSRRCKLSLSLSSRSTSSEHMKSHHNQPTHNQPTQLQPPPMQLLWQHPLMVPPLVATLATVATLGAASLATPEPCFKEAGLSKYQPMASSSCFAERTRFKAGMRFRQRGRSADHEQDSLLVFV